MLRVAGVNLPPNKHIEIALTYIYGVGRVTAKKICEILSIPFSKKVKDFTEEEAEKIRKEVAKFKVEGDLRRQVAMNIKRKIDIGCYQGRRHKLGLPVHGQRTHTNARTRKGRRRIAVSKAKDKGK